ncbi:hypothetical protein DERP_007149 [Dermatophagoides pteronyssinus]|uniref:Uncharacterized protein n=1 Tax=Dermatophagoides pteronyssinus TaxID=6956 RepID=A0ABQ8JUF6_DERPT|nr:hypothetical protein DERP_007149 [Dermatophagoides pteronyssinus]
MSIDSDDNDDDGCDKNSHLEKEIHIDSVKLNLFNGDKHSFTQTPTNKLSTTAAVHCQQQQQRI